MSTRIMASTTTLQERSTTDEKGQYTLWKMLGIWLAGGGVKPGQRIGATDDFGYLAIERPTPFRDLHATILAALGLHNDELSYHTHGRQERLTGVAGTAKVIPGVLA